MPFVLALMYVPRLIRTSRKLSRVEHVGRGRCPECGYDQAGGVQSTCQECGYAFTEQELQRLNNIAPGLRRKRELSENGDA